MDKTKKIILLIISMLLIIVVIIIGKFISILKEQNKKENEYTFVEEIEVEDDLKLIDKHDEYYSVLNAISNYYSCIGQKENKRLYGIMDKNYVKNNNINEENILNSVEKIEFQEPYYQIEKAVKQDGYTILAYYVYGKLKQDMFSQETIDTYLKVYVDNFNSAYSIYPITKEEYGKLLKSGEKVDDKEILLNSYNKYNNITVNNETISTQLLYNFKAKVNNDIESAYSCLDPEYKEKRFSNIEQFEQFIKFSKIRFAMLSKFKINSYNNYTQYVCIDQNGNYYIFKEESVMNYTVILDTYTLDLPEFMEKYDKGTDKEKIKLNINKIIEAINNQDYQYVYNKLDKTFKNNNFNNINTFENYIKNNFYNKNEIKDFNYRQEANVFICTLGLSNRENETAGTKSITILIKLLENRDFVISFSI